MVVPHRSLEPTVNFKDMHAHIATVRLAVTRILIKLVHINQLAAPSSIFVPSRVVLIHQDAVMLSPSCTGTLLVQ